MQKNTKTLLTENLGVSEKILDLISSSEDEIKDIFNELDDIATAPSHGNHSEHDYVFLHLRRSRSRMDVLFHEQLHVYVTRYSAARFCQYF